MPSSISSVLVLTPEPPYPLRGGGPYRIASLLHYFARFADIDLILLSDSGQPALLPDGLVRSQTVIPLPHHRKDVAARYFRNARRAVTGIPPLVDRVAGLESALSSALAGKRWDLGIVEHFWAAPYLPILRRHCREIILDLHNVESILHDRCAGVSSGFIALGHRRFGAASRRLESRLLPEFSAILATSPSDASFVRKIAPSSRVWVYPNALPWVDAPQTSPSPAVQPTIVFSGNFEYHPNIDAVRYLMSEIWPALHRRHSQMRLRLVGRGDDWIRSFASGPNVEMTGPVENALAEIAAASVVIAPLRAGSGTRIKILEAWASARPVVATTLAAEGLNARHGQNLLLADTAAAFIESIEKLLAEADFNRGIALAGRSTFETAHTWEIAWKALDAHLQLTISDGLNRYTG